MPKSKNTKAPVMDPLFANCPHCGAAVDDYYHYPDKSAHFASLCVSCWMHKGGSNISNVYVEFREKSRGKLWEKLVNDLTYVKQKLG